MLKEGDLQVEWEDGDLVISFFNEDEGEVDQYIVESSDAYDLCKFLVKKFSKSLKAELSNKFKLE